MTKALADLLLRVEVPVQIALLDCLDRRRDPSALAAVAEMADSSDPDVRLAAINALGDGATARWRFCSRAKRPGRGQEKIAARQALVNLRCGEVTPALLEAFTTATATVKPS